MGELIPRAHLHLTHRRFPHDPHPKKREWVVKIYFKRQVKDMSKKKEIDKDRLVNNEINRLTKLFKDIDRNKRLTAKGLIEEAAYMKITLQELKVEIDKHGPIDEMPQGDYSILREHPALKSYNTMVQRYTNIIDKLTNLHPKEEIKKEVDDGFEDFVMMK